MAYIIEDQTGAWAQKCRENRGRRLGQAALKTTIAFFAVSSFTNDSPLIGLGIAAFYIGTAKSYALSEKGFKDLFHREACDRMKEANPDMQYEPKKEDGERIFQKHLIPFMA
jgi:hypothetical protein